MGNGINELSYIDISFKIYSMVIYEYIEKHFGVNKDIVQGYVQ